MFHSGRKKSRSRLGLISAWRSLHELELRMFYYDPSYCLSSGGSPAVLAMTIRSNTDLGRRAETHLATITATSNSILFHAGHRKLGQHSADAIDESCTLYSSSSGDSSAIQCPVFSLNQTLFHDITFSVVTPDDVAYAQGAARRGCFTD
jgi:hypothetical protein